MSSKDEITGTIITNDKDYQENINPHFTAKQRKTLLEGDSYPVDKEKYNIGYGEETVMKYDTDKVRMELIPPELLESVATILTFGANKYRDRGWEEGMEWSRVYGALLRHMNAWWAGDSLDLETGKSHLWHAGCCISFLITYEQRNTGTDDRRKNNVQTKTR